MPVDYDDEYVADLLKQDAKDATKKYELVGIDAFNPKKRLRPGAPRPNTNFLRHIIQQTDSHNAALLAKEAEESNARLRSMDRENVPERQIRGGRRVRRTDGRLTPEPNDDDHRGTSKRRCHGDDEDEFLRRKHRRRDRGNTREQSDRRRYADPESKRSSRQSNDVVAGERSRTREDRDKHRREDRHQFYSDYEDSASGRRERSRHRHRKRHRSRSTSLCRSRSRSRSASPRPRKHDSKRRYRERERERGRDYDRKHHVSSRKNGRGGDAGPSRSTGRREEQHRDASRSDSDPLEAIVGPLPPCEADVRSRGRGAHKANGMGIESRFSSTYDPTMDGKLDSDAEDEWGSNVEAFRDRLRWKQQGAERLRAAGFTESQINKWEKGGERNEDDVVWAGKGQAREWDRGKIIDEDGDTALMADFGRLK